MITSRGLARSPYEITVHCRPCRCDTPPRQLAVGRNLERLIATAAGYYNLVTGFDLDPSYLLRFTVTDRRTGAIMWQDGKTYPEEEHSGITIQAS